MDIVLFQNAPTGFDLLGRLRFQRTPQYNVHFTAFQPIFSAVLSVLKPILRNKMTDFYAPSR
jgi:hypothetical protein